MVSEVSLGTWLGFGAHGDPAVGRACFFSALDCGIHSFDTADVYAFAEMERP